MTDKETNVQHTPETRAISEAVANDAQRIMVNTVAMHERSCPDAGSAVLEGFLFAFCAVVYDTRPPDLTAADVAAMIAEQAAKYMASFDADAVIGAAQGTA